MEHLNSGKAREIAQLSRACQGTPTTGMVDIGGEGVRLSKACDDLLRPLQQLPPEALAELAALVELGRQPDATADDWDDLVDRQSRLNRDLICGRLLADRLLAEEVERGLKKLGEEF